EYQCNPSQPPSTPQHGAIIFSPGRLKNPPIRSPSAPESHPQRFLWFNGCLSVKRLYDKPLHCNMEKCPRDPPGNQLPGHVDHRSLTNPSRPSSPDVLKQSPD